MYTTQNSNGFIMKNQDLIPADLGNETGQIDDLKLGKGISLVVSKVIVYKSCCEPFL